MDGAAARIRTFEHDSPLGRWRVSTWQPDPRLRELVAAIWFRRTNRVRGAGDRAGRCAGRRRAGAARAPAQPARPRGPIPDRRGLADRASDAAARGAPGGALGDRADRDQRRTGLGRNAGARDRLHPQAPDPSVPARSGPVAEGAGAAATTTSRTSPATSAPSAASPRPSSRATRGPMRSASS